MPLITGPELDKVKGELVEWYQTTREMLIKALEEGYPYGSLELSPAEQLQRFLDMTPEESQYMATRLAERYRGLPNQNELVEADLKAYTDSMTRMMGGVR